MASRQCNNGRISSFNLLILKKGWKHFFLSLKIFVFSLPLSLFKFIFYLLFFSVRSDDSAWSRRLSHRLLVSVLEEWVCCVCTMGIFNFRTRLNDQKPSVWSFMVISPLSCCLLFSLCCWLFTVFTLCLNSKHRWRRENDGNFFDRQQTRKILTSSTQWS